MKLNNNSINNNVKIEYKNILKQNLIARTNEKTENNFNINSNNNNKTKWKCGICSYFYSKG